jgi:hypothetical protein
MGKTVFCFGKEHVTAMGKAGCAMVRAFDCYGEGRVCYGESILTAMGKAGCAMVRALTAMEMQSILWLELLTATEKR